MHYDNDWIIQIKKWHKKKKNYPSIPHMIQPSHAMRCTISAPHAMHKEFRYATYNLQRRRRAHACAPLHAFLFGEPNYY